MFIFYVHMYINGICTYIQWSICIQSCIDYVHIKELLYFAFWTLCSPWCGGYKAGSRDPQPAGLWFAAIHTYVQCRIPRRFYTFFTQQTSRHRSQSLLLIDVIKTYTQIAISVGKSHLLSGNKFKFHTQDNVPVEYGQSSNSQHVLSALFSGPNNCNLIITFIYGISGYNGLILKDSLATALVKTSRPEVLKEEAVELSLAIRVCVLRGKTTYMSRKVPWFLPYLRT
jgi:hypothetical protein